MLRIFVFMYTSRCNQFVHLLSIAFACCTLYGRWVPVDMESKLYVQIQTYNLQKCTCTCTQVQTNHNPSQPESCRDSEALKVQANPSPFKQIPSFAKYAKPRASPSQPMHRHTVDFSLYPNQSRPIEANLGQPPPRISSKSSPIKFQPIQTNPTQLKLIQASIMYLHPFVCPGLNWWPCRTPSNSGEHPWKADYGTAASWWSLSPLSVPNQSPSIFCILGI